MKLIIFLPVIAFVGHGILSAGLAALDPGKKQAQSWKVTEGHSGVFQFTQSSDLGHAVQKLNYGKADILLEGGAGPC